MALNSKIILSKDILMDRNYKNVINYTEDQMLSLCTNNMIASDNNYSFIPKKNNVIDVHFTYNQCLQANYLAFQNSNYSNKWFFAFIDTIEYRSNSMTRITFTVDEFSTWYDYWDPKACYVIREHVANDTVGSNTIREDVELGDFVGNGTIKINEDLYDTKIMIQVSEYADSDNDPVLTNVGGIPQAGAFYVCDNNTQLASIINLYNNTGKINAIKNVYMVPSIIVNNTSGTLRYSGQSSAVKYNFSIAKPTKIGNYTPRNKKLLTYPYNYLIFSNLNGSANILKYELFDSTDAQIMISGIPVMGGSIVATPRLYNGSSLNYDESLICGKFPSLSWSADNYTNWLRQNAINIGSGWVSNSLQALTSVGLIASGNFVSGGASLVSTGLSVANSVSQKYQAEMIPNSLRGSLNAGDIFTSIKRNTFLLKPMSIKEEYARVIDDYFTRFGYAINRIKVPSQTSRTNWNYVQIGNSECIGYSNNKAISIPSNSMEIINQIFRNGVTIWHNHSNIGNYNLSN